MNDIVTSIRRAIPPVHREGYPFIGVFALVTLAAFAWVSTSLGWIALGLTLWCVTFFRDPQRVTPIRDGLVISPADGRVSFVGPAIPPPELGLSDTPLPRVSIFMSVFDCHVNRAPVGGRIQRQVYKAGLFLNADLDKASEDNERNSLIIDAAGQKFGVVQIAGLVARRIVPFLREGDMVAPGERFGLIRFGSRVDVYFPEGVRPTVALGQRAIAGETILADARAPADTRHHRVS
jgi:phosphatidylserine decarboxylase